MSWTTLGIDVLGLVETTLELSQHKKSTLAAKRLIICYTPNFIDRSHLGGGGASAKIVSPQTDTTANLSHVYSSMVDEQTPVLTGYQERRLLLLLQANDFLKFGGQRPCFT